MPTDTARLRVSHCSVKQARKLVKAWHRHLKEVQGGLFAAKLVDATGEPVGVAIAGNPCQEWEGTGRIVITRVAVSDDGRLTPQDNACSRLYGALCRAAQALGYCEAWTYTLPGEPGTSLKAAGFADMGMTDGGEHSRATRPRRPAKNAEPKRRWMRTLRSAA